MPKRIHSRYEKIVELYNSGIIDIEDIVEKTKLVRGTVNIYLKRADKEGLIQYENKYKRLVNLYNSGITDVDKLVKKLKMSKRAVEVFLQKASNKGLVSYTKKFDRLVESYNLGMTDKEDLTEKFGLTVGTVYSYLSKANKQGLIKLEKTSTKKGESNVEEKDIEIVKTKIMKDLQDEYPIKVARKRNIQSSLVYETIESLSDTEKRNLLKMRLQNNPLYNDVNNLKTQNEITVLEAMKELSKTLSLEDNIQLAKMYYLLGKNNIAIEILDNVLSTSDLDIEVMISAQKEKVSIKQEAIAEMLRKKRDNPKTCLYVCRYYNVSLDFAYDVLGYKIETQDYGEERYTNNGEKARDL